jgi:hypothetical protein
MMASPAMVAIDDRAGRPSGKLSFRMPSAPTLPSIGGNKTTPIAGVHVRGRSSNFAAREAGYGPSLHSPQCSIIPAIEAIAVMVSPPRHDSGPLVIDPPRLGPLKAALGSPADAPETSPGWNARPALARFWGSLCGVGHPGFVAFAAVAPMIPMTVPRAITSAPVEPVTAQDRQRRRRRRRPRRRMSRRRMRSWCRIVRASRPGNWVGVSIASRIASWRAGRAVWACRVGRSCRHCRHGWPRPSRSVPLWSHGRAR